MEWFSYALTKLKMANYNPTISVREWESYRDEKKNPSILTESSTKVTAAFASKMSRAIT